MIYRLLLLLLILIWFSYNSSPKCLKEYTGVSYKRNFYYKGMSLPVVIESSERASHLFVNNVLYILITEVLKYKAVKIVHRDHPIDYFKVIGRLSNLSEDDIPKSMVNMETWLPHSLEVDNENIVEAGPLGPIGVFGWFVPSNEVESFWKNFGMILNHWKSLTTNNISKLFSWDIQNVYSKSITPNGGTWCDMAYDHCHDGIFVVNKSLCSGVHDHNCAILFSSYPDMDRGYIVEQIRKFGIWSNVAWLGENLKCFLNKILQAKKPVVFFNWSPNDITSMSKFDLVQFPQHFKQSPQDPLSKHYILKKLMWKVLRTHLPDVDHIISHLQFNHDELGHELSKFPMKWTDSIVNQLACDWLKSNPLRWKTWIPSNPFRKTPIYVGGLFPKGFPSIREGARMAVELLNDDDRILKDYEIVLLAFTIPCDQDGAVTHFLRAIHNATKQPAAIIGPTCYEAADALVGISTFFNKLIISFGSEVNWRRKSSSESFFDVMPGSNNIVDIYISIMKMFNWSQMALIVQDHDLFKQQYVLIKDRAASDSIETTYKTIIDLESTTQKLTEVVEGFKSSKVRVIILLTEKQLSMRMLCLSSKMEASISHGYIWFIQSSVVSLESQPLGEEYCSSKELFQALRGSFVVQPSSFGSLNRAISVGGGSVMEWRDLYRARLNALAMQESVYGSFAFDAILSLGLALNNLIKEDPSCIESIDKLHILRKFIWQVRNLDIDGFTGPISFANSQRVGSFDVSQIQENGSVHIIGRFDLSKKNLSGRLVINESTLMMLHPALLSLQAFVSHSCGVESFRSLLNVECDVAIIIINIMCLLILFVLAISCLILIKRRYDIKVRAACDRMEELGLFSQDTSWLCLDQWEVPRDNVVLNRKLGEGAFGTVFGGEANIGGMWVAAAVKTLKLSSKPEEKLDFLSEAEMMKRFNHENIVKLLGVCTRGEPTLAIMEFMLHGDLKTFLLSRRQLVGQTGREAEDVSPLQLTKMAHDVAHGLLYLSSLNYVHRDLACRNCLVHANKAVKIGDFGMTRPMNDSDYYRFNKRGMFPVRWMAPESLSDGLFGTPSDVWSYGVLLYEIITFGSFPYQGLSNRQVLNFVKSGNILSMPAECPPKVESLLKRCWMFDPKNRPRVNELIEMLTEMPALLTPCLDTPSTSVNMDGPWSLEMNLLPRVRHRNQYQKNLIVSDRMSAPSSTLNPSSTFNSSRLSSPPFCQNTSDTTNPEDQVEVMNHGLGSCDMMEPEVSRNSDHQGSGMAIQCEMDESFLSQDTTHLCHASIYPDNKFKDGSLLSVKRSLSADDKTLFDAKLWGNISSRICRLYADKIRSKIEEMKKVERRESEKSSIKRRTLLPVLSGLGEQEGFATEPRQNNRKSTIGPQQLTFDSRTDSDYCSQHSKDFSAHIGTALL